MSLQEDSFVAHTRCLLTPRAMTLSLQVSYGMYQPISASCQRPLAQSGPDQNKAAQSVKKLKLITVVTCTGMINGLAHAI